MSLANGSPATTAASTHPSGRVRLKLSISALVHRDLRRGRRAQDDEELRRRQRRLDLFGKVAARRQVLLIAKNGRQPARHDSVGGQLSGERTWNPEPLELAVKPVGKLLVAMAVAQERVIAGPQARHADMLLRSRDRYPGNWASLAIGRPQRVPLTVLTQWDKSERICAAGFADARRSAYMRAPCLIRPWRDIERRKSRQIMVGTVPVGGDAPITVQTMTNTPTEDAKATIDQIRRCEDAGADIIRVSCPTAEAPRR